LAFESSGEPEATAAESKRKTMENYQTIVILYIIFIWLIVIHTFEEISQEIFGIKIGPITLSKKKYLIGASLITTINLGTLALILYECELGLYIGLFTSLIFGISQGIVHTIGYIKEGRNPRKFGAGFYSSLPLAVAGGILLYSIIEQF
jgi:hypothetical protein